MSWIMKITFGKSRSASYNKAVKYAQSLPNFSIENEVVICGAKSIFEYIKFHCELEQLMQLVEKWKSSCIYFYDNQYNKLPDFWTFRERVTRDAGKYAPVLKSQSIGMDSITMEDLPYPIVYYPAHYGAFFAFAKDIGEQLYFCECEREAIENYIALRKQSPLKNYSGPKTYPLGNDYFPIIVSEESKKCPQEPLDLFKFEENLCHRCNNKIPKLEYCHKMYSNGSKFKLSYGWFINQEFFKCGIDPYQYDNALSDKCPPEIYDYFIKRNTLRDKLSVEPNNSDYEEELRLYTKEFNNAIENLARKSLGFKNIGETWISETILFNIVQGLYPDSKVIKHYRTKWLQGLELDIFLPEHNLAFEYQGIQHFVAVEHWGGEKQLKKQQEHDQRKKVLCIEKGVNLICINYDDNLTVDFVKYKISTEYNL